jgi:tetratricopeptide (TPR) repeat protein
MLNLVISLLFSTLVAVTLTTFAGLNIWYSSMASLAVFTVLYLLLTRHIMKKVGVLLETAQRDIQVGRSEKAVKTLQSGYRYGNWQFFVKAQLNAQIGTILYLKRDFSAAFDYLQKGFARHWVAMGMLAICYMKRNKPRKMIEAFEKAVAGNKKEPFVWNLYAFCLEKIGEKEKAITILEKGLKKTGGDERLQANLEALKAGKKMKMKGYGDLWYQFHLEKPGAVIKQQTRALQGRRKIVRR